MDNNFDKTRTFEVAKSKIKDLSSQLSLKTTLQVFPVKQKFWSILSHKVTGQEMNGFVKDVQSSFIQINESTIEAYKIFGEIYNAFESLDKEYIHGILAGVKAAEVASNQAKEASKQALDATLSADVIQGDIKRTLEALEITVSVLKEFKTTVSAELANLKKLYDDLLDLIGLRKIDDLNSLVISLEKSITVLSESLQSLNKKNETENIELRKKIRISYVIAGGSLLLTTLQFILNLTGVI